MLADKSLELTADTSIDATNAFIIKPDYEGVEVIAFGDL